MQSAHAVREFHERFPDIDREWFANSNYIILLTCKDQREFLHALRRADYLGIEHADFHEPDMDMQVTATAFCPSAQTAHMLRHYQLLGSTNVKTIE